MHSLDVRVRLWLALAFLLAVSLAPVGAWPAYGLFLALLLASMLLMGQRPGVLWRRSLVALPFALAAVTVLFTLPGPTWVALPLGPWRLTVSEPGATRFASIMLKSWLSVQAALLLAAATPPPQLIQALGWLHLPRVLVAVAALMWRYLLVLTDEATRLQRARLARSARAGQGSGGTLAWRAQVTGKMAGNLFLRSYERSERVYDAMLARGYRGEMRTAAAPPWSSLDLLIGVLGSLVLAAIAVVPW